MSENIQRRRSNGNIEKVSQLYREMGSQQFSLNQLLKRKSEIAKLMSSSKSNSEKDGYRHEGVTLKEKIREMEENLRSLQEKLAMEASQLPNWCHADVPLGPYEDAKVVGYINEDIPLSRFGNFSFVKRTFVLTHCQSSFEERERERKTKKIDISRENGKVGIYYALSFREWAELRSHRQKVRSFRF